MAQGFQGSLSTVRRDNPDCPLPVSGVYLFLCSTVSEIEEAEKGPHPREPLSGTPTAKIGGRDMTVQCITYTVPVFV